VIPDSFIQDLLARVDVVDVVERYVPLKKSGANFSARCPFHNEKTPSFTVSPAKQFYYCFGCGAKGSAIGFVMEYAGLGFREAVQELASGVGMKVPDDDPTIRRDGAKKTGEGAADLYEILAQAMEFYRSELRKSSRAIDYLKGRGLTGEIAARFRIGYAPDAWTPLEKAFPDYQSKALVESGLVKIKDEDDARGGSREEINSRVGEAGADYEQASGGEGPAEAPNDAARPARPEARRYDRFRDRIMFPIINQKGQVIGFGGRVLDKGEPKYLNSPETPVFEKGRELYGLPQARQAIRETGTVVVVEGYMDVVALAQMDVGNAVASLGTATTPTHVQKLMKQAERIVFCFDGDAAGRKAAWRALENSLTLLADDRFVGFVFLPVEDDPDTYVRKNGKDAFVKLLDDAMPLSQYLLEHLAEGRNLKSPEGRSGFLHAAKPLITQIAAPGLRLQLFKRVAELSGVSQQEVEALYSARASAPSRPPAPARGRRAPVARHFQSILQLIALQPALAGRLELDLFDRDTETGAAAHALVEWITDNADRGHTPGMLFEHFRGSVVEPFLATSEVVSIRDKFDEADIARDFDNLQVALRLTRYQEELDGLMAKSGNAHLTAEEDLRFMQLRQQLETLKRTQQSPT
jgi:DNA primase